MVWSPGAQSFYLHPLPGAPQGSINCIVGIQDLLIPAVAADDTLLRVSTNSLNGDITHHQCIFAVLIGAAVGASIFLLLSVFVTDRLLARAQSPSQFLSSGFLLISYLMVATSALAISLVGVPTGWWKE